MLGRKPLPGHTKWGGVHTQQAASESDRKDESEFDR